jgi:hypothetical protein
MTSRSLLITAAVVLSAALAYPTDSAAQRQRSPGGNGRQQESGGGGERQRDNGGGGARQRDGGGSRQRDDGGARPQGGGQAAARAAQPRGEPVDRGDRGSRARVDGGRRESPSEVRESTPPPQVRATPPPETRTDAAPQSGDRQVRRRFPTEAERANGNRGGNVADGNRGGNAADSNRAGTVVADRDRRSIVRGSNGVSNGSRVAVPRAVAPSQRWEDRNGRNVYGSYYRGRNVYGRYAYHGGRNIYIVPRGRTYYYYPRYYYNPYSFGYGPAGRGHFYFDLHYNSYIWHPYSVSRYGYGSYGYPVGELRLKVEPRDAQVFIDGYYAGRVDDFDGVFQSLRLEEGEYQVEIVLPGYEPLAFDVRIFPGEKTTYEGDLIPE